MTASAPRAGEAGLASTSGYRTERDALGEKRVASGAYYGIFTQRADENFRISGHRVHESLISAIALIKKAAAAVNAGQGLLEPRLGKAISRAADEVISGKLKAEFPLDAFQAGAGTPTNMNVNEVIANRANEMLGKPLGSYHPVHPNDHVNMGQSSNDVVPTACRIACALSSGNLLAEADSLAAALRGKEKEFGGILKPGRTHLQDAVPVRLGQEFGAFATAVEQSRRLIAEALESVRELGIGGTAAGTGLNTLPGFSERMASELSALTGEKFRPAKDLMHTTASMSALLHLSAALRGLAVELGKMSDDLRLLSSGPRTGISEIALPEVEPGSSIMPGKVNPSVPECMNLVCFHVRGFDHAIELSSASGQLQLNFSALLIGQDLLASIGLLANGMRMLRERCISGIAADGERCRSLLEGSFCAATALAPYLGYDAVAFLVKRGLKEGKGLREVMRDIGLLDEKELRELLEPGRLTAPHAIDSALVRKLRQSATGMRSSTSRGG